MDRDQSIRRAESRFTGAGGLSLFRRSWLPIDAERTLLLIHGFAEHSGRYDHVGAWFAARGCAVHAYDQRGHGRTPGRRGHVAHFSELLDDLEAILATVRGEHPDLPLTLVGHSMGGLVLASFARERKPEREAVALVTSGAGLELEPQSRLRLAVGRALRRVWPTFRTDAGIDVETLSRDPEVGRRYLEDPFVDTHMTISLGVEFYAAAARADGGGRPVRLPMLMLHGGADRLCRPAGTERFYASLPHEEVPGSELRIYPELRHEIFNEPEQEKVFSDILEWVVGREAMTEPPRASVL